jgi:hypothetical protein
MNLSAKQLLLLSRIFLGLTIIPIGLALFYVWSSGKSGTGPSGVLPALLGMIPLIIAASLDKAAKRKKEQESKGS